MNVVLWARVSSREQREGYSLDAQVRANRGKAEKSGWSIEKEFVVAESAKRGAERKAFNDMFRWVKANAKRKKITAILAHKLDRVCRNMRDAVRLQELEDLCGVKLSFVENQFGPGAAGALSFNVMAAVAQYYSDNLRTEVLKGMDEKVRQGWPTGLAPYGYTNVDNKDAPVVPHLVQSKTLARIFELYGSGDYTFQTLADKLQAEGHVFRNSQSRFNRTALSYLLNNRFYIGELHRNGSVHRGAYTLVIDPRLFERCQRILAGKNRRTGNPDLMLSGCVLRCGCCDHAITGERIRKKLRGGGHNVHVYYACGNNNKPENHPKVRWREADVEAGILRELDSCRFPTKRSGQWFRGMVSTAFEDTGRIEAQKRKTLTRRRTELANMQDRLLNAYLAGTLDESVFNIKSAELRREAEDVERQLDEAAFDPANAELALQVFDFSQNLVNIWRGSNFSVRREILNCVSLNRTLDDATLCLTKRKPFDAIAEGLQMKNGRGDRI